MKDQKIQKVDFSRGIAVTLIQLVIYFLDCFIMLLLMTYNWGVFFAIVSGQILGYSFFTVKEEIVRCGEDSGDDGNPQLGGEEASEEGL